MRYIFPGVYTRIRDESFYVQPTPGTIGLIAMFTEKGPDNMPRMTVSVTDLLDTYGSPDPAKYGQGWYVAKQYLEIAGSLYIIRVLPDDATFANICIDVGANGNVSLSSEEHYTRMSIMKTDIANKHNVIFYPVGRGEWYNNVGIKLTPAADYTAEHAYILDVYTKTEDGYWALVETFTVSFDRSAKDISGESMFIEDVVNKYSQYLRVLVSDNIDPALGDPLAGEYDYVYTLNDVLISKRPGIVIKDDPEAGYYHFIFDDGHEFSIKPDTVSMIVAEDPGQPNHYSFGYEENIMYYTINTNGYESAFTDVVALQHGSDGDIYDSYGHVTSTAMMQYLSRAYIGTLLNPITEELNYEITDCDAMLFSVVFDAGYPSEVKDAIVTLTDMRGDVFAFLDNGDNGRPSDAITKRKTIHNYQTYRAALYEMYTKVWDPFTGSYIWITPIYHLARNFALTQRDYDLWWPVAGLGERGNVYGIKDVRYKLVGGYKTQFKLNQLNPIMWFSFGEYAFWGNWTTQSKPSSLQYINVVLTLQYIERTLNQNLKYHVYDLNDYYTHELLKDLVSSFLSDLQSHRALEFYDVRVYATEYDKKVQNVNIDIILRVVGAIETITTTLIVK